jgi:bifunctional non-homologous end joining protein LigD
MGENPPKGKDWVHEIKLDGYRTQARVQVGGRAAVRLLTRTGLDWTHRMRSVAAAVANLPVTSAVFDGEVVVLDSDGMSSFANLQAAFQEGARFPLTYFVFDLLHLDGRNLRGLPLLERKEILAQVLSGTPAGGPIRISEHMEGDAKTVFDGACRLGLEGIISKFATGKYVRAQHELAETQVLSRAGVCDWRLHAPLEWNSRCGRAAAGCL